MPAAETGLVARAKGLATHLVARPLLERVLSTAVERGWLDAGEAVDVGAGVLGGNAARLHGFEL